MYEPVFSAFHIEVLEKSSAKLLAAKSTKSKQL
jgi:hypothetical protein